MSYREFAHYKARKFRMAIDNNSSHTSYGNNNRVDIYNKTDTTPHLVIANENSQDGWHTPIDHNIINTAFGMLNPELHSFDDSHIFSVHHIHPSSNISAEGHIIHSPDHITNKYVYKFNHPKSETAIITPVQWPAHQRIGHIIKGVTHPEYLSRYFAHKLSTQTPIGIVHENIMQGDLPKDEQQHLQEVKEALVNYSRPFAEEFLNNNQQDTSRQAFADYLHANLPKSEVNPDIIKVLTGIDKL